MTLHSIALVKCYIGLWNYLKIYQKVLHGSITSSSLQCSYRHSPLSTLAAIYACDLSTVYFEVFLLTQNDCFINNMLLLFCPKKIYLLRYEPPKLPFFCFLLCYFHRWMWPNMTSQVVDVQVNIHCCIT